MKTGTSTKHVSPPAAKPLLADSCYVIYFSGLFQQGYVRSVFWKRGHKKENIHFETEKEALDFATKYRFKWYADFLCWMYNKLNDRNFGFRTYSVKEFPCNFR